MTYHRTLAQRQHDHLASKEFEAVVAEALGPGWVNHTDSTTRLDFHWLPGDVWLDVKEKRQPLTERWWLIQETPPEELFVLDELSVRKGLVHHPDAYYLLRDVPRDRLYLASITELAMVERVRRNRAGKGKWILDLRNFERVELRDLDIHILERRTPLLGSECLAYGELQVRQV